MCSNIPASPAYGVYISQLIRYARGSSNYSDFLATLSELFKQSIPHCRNCSSKTFNIVGTVQTKHSTLSELFQRPFEKIVGTETKSIP